MLATPAEFVIIACGVWAPLLAEMAGAFIPLTPVVHQMADYGPVPLFERSSKAIEYPIVRDMDVLIEAAELYQGGLAAPEARAFEALMRGWRVQRDASRIVLLKELEPQWDITMLERLDQVGA